MLKRNTVVKDAVVAMQAAIETGDKEKITNAFENFGESIASAVREEFESANGDNEVLLQRGFRVLTSAEQKFYEKVIEAGKQKTVQAMNGLLTPEVMPNTIIEDVYKDLTEEHPLLERINFVSVQYLTRWILNDHTADCAVWGDVNEEISKEITSAFETIEMAQCKLSAFAVIDKDMLELGPVFLDAYIRTYLKESLAKALEKSIICGNGHKSPIGMDRDIHEGVDVNTSTGYPQKTAVKLTSFMPAEYGKVLAMLAETEKGHNRTFDQVTLICNMQDYLSKVMPATTVLTAVGSYATNLFPFTTEVLRSAELETGKEILVLPEEYFMGLGTSKEGTLEFSDEFKFLADQRVFKVKLHGMGRAYDNTVAILLDISKLKPAYVQVEMTSDVTE